MIKLRGHHALCTMLFEGKGYENSFTENMTKVVDRLPHEDIQLISDYDVICSCCPNINDACPEHCENIRIAKKDRHIMELLRIAEGETIRYSHIAERIIENMTEENFSESCSDCCWSAQGICRYDKLISSAKQKCQ